MLSFSLSKIKPSKHQFLSYSLALNMEDASFSNTSLNYKSNRHHIPENSTLHTYRRESLKSHK
jgi:hypothetical protein